jgi:transketolase
MDPGTSTTLRATLGSVLGHLNKESNGALFITSADLLESTSVKTGSKAFPDGYYHSESNPDSRTLSVGGICEDGMGSVLTGLSSYGAHVGVSSSYAAFIAPLQHIAVRLHGIGNQGSSQLTGKPFETYIMVCAHAGYGTGEDGPTHAEPQALQLLQENFPPGVCITLTPWDPQEIWPLMSAALLARPSTIAVFVTRPTEKVIDRQSLRMPPPADAVNGVYAMRVADPARSGQGTLVLQESGATNAFVKDVLPRLDDASINLNVYYVASAELFDRLPPHEQERIFPLAHRQEAMGITGFTQPTLYRWVTSEPGREDSVHAFTSGRYPGSGQAHDVLREAGLGGESQFDAIVRYVERQSPV